ncbi:MAG TPA: nucleotidyltransferase family protein [Stellaceae bacterium]|jgi:hypothetical protein
MNRERAIELLKGHEREFRDAGIASLFLFGSTAKGNDNEKSDVDLFFDLKRAKGFTLFDLVGLQQQMQDILGIKVDLMTRSGIHPRRRQRIESNAVRVF